MKLPLRRTLVRFVRYAAKEKVKIQNINTHKIIRTNTSCLIRRLFLRGLYSGVDERK